MIKLFILMRVKKVKGKVMMDNGRFLKGKMSKANPFCVPDGYFDGFASQLMDKLPERAPVCLQNVGAKKLRLKTWICAAACLCVGVFGAGIYFSRIADVDINASESETIAQTSIFVDDVYYDVAADYAMIDNADIYAYLTDASGD